jgi:voltage-gated sodium channel
VHQLRLLVASDGFRSMIVFLIAVNAFAMGLEATPAFYELYGSILDWVFIISQVIFVMEILVRWLAAPRGEFFRDSWNRFDFIIVALSLVPAVGGFVLIARVFRILRVLRIVSVGEVLLGKALRPDSRLRSAGLAVLLIGLCAYVFALSGFYLFGEAMPQWSSLARSTSMLLRSITPGGVAAVLDSGAAVQAFHAVFYLALLCIAVNLGTSLRRGPQEVAP